MLDTRQKVNFERLKQHQSRPTEFATTSLDTGGIAVTMNPESERSVEPTICLNPRYKSEQLLSEVSNVSLPSHRRHWMNTRLRTKLCARRSRPHFQQFDYSMSSTDDVLSEAMRPILLLHRTWSNMRCSLSRPLSLRLKTRSQTSLFRTVFCRYRQKTVLDILYEKHPPSQEINQQYVQKGVPENSLHSLAILEDVLKVRRSGLGNHCHGPSWRRL